MAFITLNKKKLKENYQKLDALFKSRHIDWAVVSKLLCGNKKYLEAVIELGVTQICDSRVSNLKAIKAINPAIETVFIKPPAKRSISGVVDFADISFNTELETIRLLSDAAVQRGKIHKVVIMIELGELREGVMREHLVDFYSDIFKLPGIEVIGIGTNLTCMYGVLPNHDKLIQLCIYKQLIETKFNRKIPYVSGGASVTIPLIENGLLPAGVNHFRVGETLYLGTDVYHNTTFDQMHNDVFKLYAEVIEVNEKPMVPMGELGHNLTGDVLAFDQHSAQQSAHRAIVDVGLLDIEKEHFEPVRKDMQIVGSSSDMTVIDLGQNEQGIKTGDLIEFKMDYMGILRIMHSRYIDKKFEQEIKPEVA
ncbi:Predicted amino acid racemase [Arachidicoccus rhizosphaerae]|jgi:predicted amino acid racemase|uniref:Predicted amino acid racemase n=1 Tax=Arachidicoccus rhizosphaerae TaxID=551991 RepID=A0A1H3XE96_9BACT|nr:alanine racemase [Arachidicoccus rhizosphaerae]SDZ97550.1 Predicted amino acid racemase [Arachidicoccus rhizosphaerae]